MLPSEMIAQADLLDLLADRTDRRHFQARFGSDEASKYRERARKLREEAFQLLTEEKETE